MKKFGQILGIILKVCLFVLSILGKGLLLLFGFIWAVIRAMRL